MHTQKSYITTSGALMKIQFLSVLLGYSIFLRRNLFFGHLNNLTIVCWGLRPSGCSARFYANKFNLSLIMLEDGFLRSYYAGEKSTSLSLVSDHQGIYYDANQLSDLEWSLENSARLMAGIEMKASQAQRAIICNSLSKYNNAPSTLNSHFASAKKKF